MTIDSLTNIFFNIKSLNVDKNKTDSDNQPWINTADHKVIIGIRIT